MCKMKGQKSLPSGNTAEIPPGENNQPQISTMKLQAGQQHRQKCECSLYSFRKDDNLIFDIYCTL